MKTSTKWTLACALLLAATSAVLAQTPRELFRDDFVRNGWENAMTNAFLPTWSAPGQGFLPPLTTGNGTPYQAEVVVTGTHFQVKANGQVYLELDDPDLTPGSVGVMSWAQRNASSSYPLWGTRCSSLAVTDAANTPLLTENWNLPPWTLVRVRRADNTVLTLPGGYGNMRWDFVNGGLFDDSNSSAGGTLASGIDFIGPTYAFNATGSQAWTDYLLRARLLTTDDDGMGFILRYREDSASASFYRVAFVNSGAVTGFSFQKYVVSKTSPVTITWTELLRDNTFLYTAGTPLDVSVTCRNLSPTEVQLTADIINDPDGTPTPYTFTVTDSTNPLTAGTVGVHIYGEQPVRIQTYGGNAAPTPLLVGLDENNTVLIDNVLAPGYQNWTPNLLQGIYGAPADWGLLLGMGDLCESSNGQPDVGVGADGMYKPYIMFKDGFDSGADYTLRATLVTHDDDGHGLVFGYKDNDNYFRAGFRVAGNNVGFPDGISVQKVVNGVITQLAVSTGGSLRTNKAGIWLQKFGNMAIECSTNTGLYANTPGYGAEFQGPRLVRGDVNWTDYTYESVIQTNDDDGIGLLFRYQDEQNYYRLTFLSVGSGSAGGPPPGISLQRVQGNVYTELFSDSDPTNPGDNDVSPGAGFTYALGETWTARVIATGGTFRIEIDTANTLNFYQATVVDPDPLTNGKVGMHTWYHDANEFRNIKLTLAGQGTPEFEEGTGTPDPMGWIDATRNTMSGAGQTTGGEGTGAGEPISGIGLRPDLQALGVRDNRYIAGTYIIPGNNTRGCVNFDGPRAVAGDTYWADYTYTVDLKSLDNDGIGILFRYQDENNFYRLMFLSEANNASGGPPQGVSVQKRYQGAYTELFWSGNDPGNNFIYTPGEKWTVSVDCQGANFTIHITQASDYDADGKTEYTMAFTDPADPLLGGKIGVTAWGEAAAADEGNTLLQPGGLDWTTNFHEGAVWDNVVVFGTTGPSVPDFNGDGKVNAADLILFEGCVTGPTVPMTDFTYPCDHADQDGDLDVDQDDFAVFQRCFSGDEVDANPDCIK